MGADGNNEFGSLTDVTEGSTDSFAEDPAFSPDGTRIAYAQDTSGPPRLLDGGYRPDIYSIYSMDVNGGGKRLLSDELSGGVRPDDNNDSSRFPTWSPDGTKIAFVQAEAETGNSPAVYIVNDTGTGLTRLATGVGPTFSPDGTRIFYAGDCGGSSGFCSMALDGSDKFETGLPIPDELSPDGTRMATGGGDIVVSDLDGSNSINLTSHLGSTLQTDPTFSPDGTQIAFAHRPEGGGQGIYSINVDGTNMHELTYPEPVSTDTELGSAYNESPDWGRIPCEDDSPAAADEGSEVEEPVDPSVGARRVSARTGANSPNRPAPSLAQRASDGSGGPPRAMTLEPGAAVAGAAILIRGRHLGGKRVRATVAGESAKLTKARGRSLSLVVPDVDPGPHRVVLHRGERSSSARLRVLRPFNGDLDSELDEASATIASIGPDGGEISAQGADGTSYLLQIPAGALVTEQAIKMTPVKRFKGLPLSGPAAGVELSPDGLALAVPAKLTITGAGNFGGSTVGFGTGEDGFEVSEPLGIGNTLVIEIEHFSGHGGAEAAEADIANILNPLLVRPGNFSPAVLAHLFELLLIWDERYSTPFVNLKPPKFCDRHPVCGQVVDKALRSLRSLISRLLLPRILTSNPGLDPRTL